MSTFSMPGSFMFQLDQLKKMNKDAAAMMPREFASAANLMAHPLAGAAAFSALGFGAASHAFGIWLGAAEAWQRMLAPMLDDLAPSVSDFAEKRQPPAERARAATKTLIDDAKLAADDAVNSSAMALEPVARAAAETPAAPVVAAPQVESPVSEPAPEVLRQPKAIDRPDAPDDLKLISGIGPKLEQVLNGLGVWTFAQVAEWSSEDIAWVDDYLGFKGRIGRDGWIGQAARLSDEGKKN